MESMEQIIANILKVPRKTGEEYETGLKEIERRKHLQDCIKCSGVAKDRFYPCISDPQYKIKISRRRTGLPVVSRTFENFVTRTGTEKGLKACSDYVNNHEQYPFLVLLGSRGVGKSHLCESIAFALLEKQDGVKYISSSHLLNVWRSTYNQLNQQGLSFSESLESWSNIPYLILDDLGAERSTDWSKENLGSLIDYRNANHLPLVVSSNLSDHEIALHLGARSADRIFDRTIGRTIIIEATSYRTGNNW